VGRNYSAKEVATEAGAKEVTFGFERIDDTELEGLPGPVALFRATLTESAVGSASA
jgi:hypothetical protein